jgi:diguanylate cyclase (GGDEF)-like protein
VFSNLSERGKPFWLTVTIALVPLFGLIDYLTGPEAAFGFFYLIPVSLAAWFVSFRYGSIIAVACAGAWYLADYLTGVPYTHQLIGVWNATSRFGFFVVVSWLLSALKRAFEREHALARIDYMTGAVNSRYFYELAQTEIKRLARYGGPFTVVYIDLDNFKAVNDRFGHNEGDTLLRKVVNEMKNQLRNTDVIARLGGDEFACLLPQTAQAQAKEVIDRMRRTIVKEMQEHSWPVTLSIGVLTCVDALPSVDAMIKTVDELMYSVKKTGKDNIAYSIYAT